MLLHGFPLNSQILIAANKDLDLRGVQDLRYSRHCFDPRYFLSDLFFIFSPFVRFMCILVNFWP